MYTFVIIARVSARKRERERETRIEGECDTEITGNKINVRKREI